MIIEQTEPFPCYVHCAAGKDRTGVIIAAILSILEIDPNLIRDEYLISIGLLQPKLITNTIEGMSDKRMFRKIDVQLLKEKLLIEH